MKPYDDRRQKSEQVREMFDTIAPRYDRLNRLLSFNTDRRWRRRMVRAAAAAAGGEEVRILDLATGTGDIAIELAKAMPGAVITGADLSPGMLSLAQQKVAGRGSKIAFVEAAAEELPFADDEFDIVTVAFGVRNFQDIPGGLSEMHRVLKPGGTMLVLEFSQPRGKIFGPLYRFYFKRMLPRIGGIVSGDRRAYEYLPGSVGEFAEPEEFLRMMDRAGFSGTTARKMTGGVAYLYLGQPKQP